MAIWREGDLRTIPVNRCSSVGTFGLNFSTASLDHGQEHEHTSRLDFDHHPVLANLLSPGSASPRSRAIRGGRGS